MIFHLFFLPAVLIAVLFAVLTRAISAPFRMGRWQRRHYGCGRGWGGSGSRHPYGGGLLTILALVALERLFGRRYY